MIHPPQPSEPSGVTIGLTTKPVASAFLISALFVLAFTNIKGGAQVVQAAGAGLFLAAALAAAARMPRAMLPPNPFELAMLGSVGVSAIVCLTRSSELATTYTIILPLVVLASALLVRVFSLEELLFLAAKAQALICGVVVPFHWRQLLTTLNPRSADRWMLRLSPFDMHPNLVGFAYGVGALTATYAAFRSKGIWRLIYGSAAVASVVLILGASARAGLLALVASAGVILLVAYPKLPRLWKMTTLIAALLVVVALISYWTKIYEYLEILLELNSNTRGFASGGSGRTDVWYRGIETIVSSGPQLFFGSGLRSSSYEDIGFYTENSYINIVIESGIILGGALIAIIIFGISKTLLRARRSASFEWGLYASAAIMMFAVIQSFFNRYLIGIGNYGSIFLILLYNYAWQTPRTARLPQNSTSVPTQLAAR